MNEIINDPTITQPAQLKAFCQTLTQSAWMAIDTEFLRVDTFFPQLCLVQIQSEQGHTALIDPLAFEHPIDALNPLWDCLTNPAILKVFHSGRQDIEILYQLSGKMPVSIFDTQLAGIFLGYGPSAGLAKMVEGELGIHLDKNQTRTDWSQRPLTPQQLDYALDDVRYLAPLYEKVHSQLSAEQITYLKADFNHLLTPSLYDLSPENAGHKLKGTGGLSPKQRAIAFALAQWRETFAIEHNRPRRWVLADDCILAIAKRPPKTVDALYKVPSIKAASVKNYGETWIALIDAVFAHPENWPSPLPKPAKPTAEELKLLDLLQAILSQTAQDHATQVNQIANKEICLTLLRHPSPVLSGWRHLLYEKPVRNLLQGKAQLSLKNHQIVILNP